jgi:hypothetical protein
MESVDQTALADTSFANEKKHLSTTQIEFISGVLKLIQFRYTTHEWPSISVSAVAEICEYPPSVNGMGTASELHRPYAFELAATG